MPKYQIIAKQLQDMILNGVWRSGDKLPSIRASCRRYDSSIATVLQAYQMLESQGLVQSRPQSGYYVTAQHAEDTLPCSENLVSKEVRINDLLFDVLQRGKDPKLVPFASAFPDPSLFPHRTLSRCIANATRNMPSDSSIANLPPGSIDLRRFIARRYCEKGLNVTPDDIVITSGALEALSLSLQSVTKPGDLVAIESPAFYGALQAIERLNLKAVEIPTDPIEGIDVSSLSAALSSLPIKACWLMTNMQNPTGYTLSTEKKLQLATILNAHQVPLIEDDVYAELYSGTNPPLPIKALSAQCDSLLCGSFSKSLAPGFRVGWVVANQRSEEIQRAQLMSTLSSGVPTQLGIVNYLTYYSFDHHLRKLRTSLARRKEQHVNCLQKAFGDTAQVYSGDGGYFAWLSLPKQVNIRQLYEGALKEGISIAPGIMFSSDQSFSHHLRLNTSYTFDENISKAIGKLAKLANN
ncbi:PLP-dependent aminotransferase family protein [Vibrio sonorensis]|uniref:aminotransferase-like domain-containing protein n=1 Tax=Vibrio sonorensis TaxID=1004316 RepID=UPI0008DABECB|nr:PLP-dependent aminotransferase family protein [Vibrio sonorensis]